MEVVEKTMLIVALVVVQVHWVKRTTEILIIHMSLGIVFENNLDMRSVSMRSMYLFVSVAANPQIYLYLACA